MQFALAAEWHGICGRNIIKAVKNKILLFLTLIVFTSCERQAPPEETPLALPLSIEEEIPPQNNYLTIIAVGDNLFHNVMVRHGEEGDYEAIYSEIRYLVQAADIAFINQETVLGGKEFGFTGWPLFNSPQSLGRALYKTGFNVVNHANNHAMDRGEAALQATIDFWKTLPDVAVIGVYGSQESRNSPTIIEINNFRVGFLAYTQCTNGLPVPAHRPYMVSLINREIMAREISALRPLCDVLIVSMHWGDEYVHTPNRRQNDLAAFLAEQQVDIVFGHHPHVLQPVEFIRRPDGRVMLCFFSLGNFVSAQDRTYRMLGAMAYIRLRLIPPQNEGERGCFIFMDDGVIPVVTHFERNWTNFKVYPLYSYTDELAAIHWMTLNPERAGGEFNLDFLTNLSRSVLGNRVINRNPFLSIRAAACQQAPIK